MNSHDVDPDPNLADRYGTSGMERKVAIGMAIVVGAAFLIWLVWATLDFTDPEVRSALGPWKVVDEHTVTATVEVVIEDGAEDVNCRIEALADDATHSVVGVLDFEPVDGRNEVTITTERKATAVQWVGCTAEGQPRPR